VRGNVYLSFRNFLSPPPPKKTKIKVWYLVYENVHIWMGKTFCYSERTDLEAKEPKKCE
jgi:hypothetical protein